MFLLRALGKVMLIPVWILVAIAWVFVKAVVSIYSFARGFAVLGLGALMIGTLICYHDWKQIAFLICISGLTMMVLIAGTLLEIILESARVEIAHSIIS